MRYPDLKKKISHLNSGAGVSFLLHVLIFLLFSVNTHAQSCTISQFVKSYEFEGSGIGHFLGRLHSGELYFGGSRNFHLVLHTTDKTGNSTWDKQYQCPDIDGYSSFAFASVDSVGNYFVSTDGSGIGLLDAAGNVLTSRLMKNIYPGMYCISIGILPDNKKVVLVRDQMTHGDGNGYAVICLSADLSSVVWTRYFSHYDCYFFTMDVLNNKIFVPGSVDQVGTLLCFDAETGSLLSTNSYNNDYNRTFFDKIYRYNGGYIVVARRWASVERPYKLILRLDDNLNVINSYLLNELWENALLALAVQDDGSYHGAWGSELSAGSYSFAMSKTDKLVWSRFNSSINYRPQVYCNTPEGFTLLGYGLQSIGDPPVTHSSLVLSRTDEEGRLANCPSSDAPLTMANVDYSKSMSSMIPVDTSFITLLPTSMLVSTDTYNLVERCKNVSSCNTVAIMGNTDLCNANTAQFIARRNKECSAPVTWTINNDLVVQTNLNDSTLSIKFPGAGNYTLTATLSGCKLISDTVKIHITSSIPTLNLGPDTMICPGNNILLNARKGFSSYLWQNGATDSIFTVTQPGKYFVTTTDACSGIYSDTILIDAHAPIFFDAGADRIKCNEDTIQLHATPGFLNYHWLPDYHLNTATSPDVIANPLTDTAYIVKAEKTPGCFAYDTVQVKVNHSMPINLGTDTSFCLGDSIIFNAGNHFASYTWSNNSSASFIKVRTAGTYFVDAISAEGCHSFDTAEVKVFANPVVALDHNNNLCSGQTKLLDAGKFTFYLWNDGSSKETLLISKPGSYYVRVTDENNCQGIDTTFITHLLPSPKGFLPHDTSMCSYATLVLNAKPGFANYLWSNNSSAPSVTINKAGVYSLQVTDNNNCMGKESVTVSLKDCMQGFYIPNAFTPNHDGLNDVFKPVIFGNVIHYSFVVYNRFGQKVFESTDLSRAWDGSFHNMNSAANIFAWTCSYQFAGGNVENKKGSVLLMR
ncbi:MAG: gliding motility-associated C-terminal domain-containing protein [Ferruginibacter sp.]